MMNSSTGRCQNECPNSQTPSLIHLKPLHIGWIFFFFSTVTDQRCSSQLPVIANYPGMVSKRRLNTSTVIVACKWNAGDLAIRMLAKSMIDASDFYGVDLHCNHDFYSSGALRRIAGERPSYPQLVSGLFGLQRAHSVLFFFLYFLILKEPATGSHYDLDLTCTNNIPGLI